MLPARGRGRARTYDVRLTSKPVGAASGSKETRQVVVLSQPPAGCRWWGSLHLFRRGPFTGADWAPVADLRFRRQERVKIEAAIVGAEGPGPRRLLDRAGSPLPLPMVSSERKEGGARIVSVKRPSRRWQSATTDLEASIGSGVAAKRALVRSGSSRRRTRARQRDEGRRSGLFIRVRLPRRCLLFLLSSIFCLLSPVLLSTSPRSAAPARRAGRPCAAARRSGTRPG